MEVTISPPSVTSGISFYRASAGDSSCKVPPDVSSLVCLIRNLPAGSRFEVKAYACTTGGVCSSPVVADGYTLPDGNLWLSRWKA